MGCFRKINHQSPVLDNRFGDCTVNLVFAYLNYNADVAASVTGNVIREVDFGHSIFVGLPLFQI
ncbi:MAG TPA: hypothetical protein DCX54_01605 [Flavobacteriales bacterium]|nr:hypothetical protein [Flavobacteriales bacterium]